MRNWQGQKVVIIGAARQGIALARYLVAAGARVILNDQLPASQLQSAQQALADLSIEWVCGGHPLSLLEGTDCVCPSGGVPFDLPLLEEARQRGIAITNDSQIFLECVPCPVIGITGSAGKTTTTMLVGRIAEHAGQQGAPFPRRVWVGGNIGNPLIASLGEISQDDLVVMELSSFQLEVMTISPQFAVILNITPNHLDRHKTMAAYTAAKARLLDFQPRGSQPMETWGNPAKACAAVLGREDSIAWGLVERAHCPVWLFGHDLVDRQFPGAFVSEGWVCIWNGTDVSRVMPVSEIQLRGRHNLLNVLAACAVSAAAGLSFEAMRRGISSFNGAPHRLEFVRSWGGARWYNDSIATAPERSMAALRSFDEPIVLLAGGRDKDLPWDDFARLVRQRVDHLILFGECAEKIHKAVGDPLPGERPFTLAVCKDLYSAVQQAARIVESGDVVLLSPGGTSFDEFRDFEARGEAFRKWVQELS